jgi:hypothetical protein
MIPIELFQEIVTHMPDLAIPLKLVCVALNIRMKNYTPHMKQVIHSAIINDNIYSLNFIKLTKDSDLKKIVINKGFKMIAFYVSRMRINNQITNDLMSMASIYDIDILLLLSEYHKSSKYNSHGIMLLDLSLDIYIKLDIILSSMNMALMVATGKLDLVIHMWDTYDNVKKYYLCAKNNRMDILNYLILNDTDNLRKQMSHMIICARHLGHREFIERCAEFIEGELNTTPLAEYRAVLLNALDEYNEKIILHPIIATINKLRVVWIDWTCFHITKYIGVERICKFNSDYTMDHISQHAFDIGYVA